MLPIGVLSGTANNESKKIFESIAFSPVPAASYIYIGPSARSVRYVGVRSDAQMYFGKKALFP